MAVPKLLGEQRRIAYRHRHSPDEEEAGQSARKGTSLEIPGKKAPVFLNADRWSLRAALHFLPHAEGGERTPFSNIVISPIR